MIPLNVLTIIAFVLSLRHSACTPTARTRPGTKIPTKPRNAPKTVGKRLYYSANAPRYTPNLKFGPGKAWIIASPIRKSRDET